MDKRQQKLTADPSAPQVYKTAMKTPPRASRVAPAPKRPSSDLQDNLRTQTPLNRRLRQKTAPTEPGTVRRQKKQQFHIKKEVKRPSFSFIGKRILLVLIAYGILLPICLFLISLWLPHHTTPETNDYIYQLGPDSDVISRKIYPWDLVRKGMQYYLDMNTLADYCELATTGSAERMRYIVKDTGETIEFVLDQSVAYVNGLEVRTGADSYIRGDVVYVSMDFINRCFTGVTATVDLEKNKITVVRATDEEGDYLPITFPFKQQQPSEQLNFPELDIEIQNQIMEQNKPLPIPTPTPDENVT